MFKKYFIISVLISSFVNLQGQSKEDKKHVKKLLKEAQLSFDIEDHLGAWSQYRQVLKLDSKNEKAGVNIAITFFKINYSLDSAQIFIPSLISSGLIDAKYYLAKIKHQQKSFDEAIQLLSDYNRASPKSRLRTTEEANYLIDICKSAKTMISQAHRSVIKNMGPEINSIYSDYVPVIVPDENTLYFTSRREGSSNNKKDAYGNYFEDVYVSHKENGKWQKAENVGTPINSETNDACVAISPDGQRMILYRTAEDKVTGDLYITKLGLDNKWEPLKKMIKEINSQFTETSACFTNDTNLLYFSSNRPGGYGGKDIYRIKKLPNGKWALPFNLGPNINTLYDEDSPFLHPDNVTLYFSSKGHNTMGEYDVFKSVYDPEANTFSKAENLGYPINDVGNDIFFILNVNGQRGFYSSLKEETIGSSDIFEIDTRFGDNDLKVKHGMAFKDGIPSKVKITLLDNEGNAVNGTYNSNPKTGKFILIVNPLKSYKAIVEFEGYTTLVVDVDPIAFEKIDKDFEFKLIKK
ncbi:MAG: hypothetical protein Q8N66_10195 [Bacteroidota bacterium]|nr:hypothetical protein [Bacteroidota bacterium]